MSRKALGRGLKALIPDTEPSGGQSVLELDVERVTPSRYQPRQDIDSEALRELALSIKSLGIIQPIIVQPADGRTYELIAGERRWRAAKEAGLTTVPAIVRKADDPETLELALIENLQREDLNPIEAAHAYRKLTAHFELTQEEVAAKVGKDRSSVANHLRLLKLPPQVQEDLSHRRLSMGHARALLSLPSKEKQLRARRAIISRGLSVREAERLVRKVASQAARPIQKHAKKDIYINKIEDSLRRSLGTKVRVVPSGAGGKIEIRYFSAAELDRLADHITGEGE